MRIRVRFECYANLPRKPKGLGHIAEKTVEALRNADEPELDSFLGPAPGTCSSKNITTLDVEGGSHELVCSYCGVQALTVFVNKDAVVVHHVAAHCTLPENFGVELLDE